MTIINECKHYIKSFGSLNPGDVFINDGTVCMKVAASVMHPALENAVCLITGELFYESDSTEVIKVNAILTINNNIGDTEE